MSTNTDRASAKIYQFPARGRFAPHAAEARVANSDVIPRALKISFGSSWYHDEAIREAELTRKN